MRNSKLAAAVVVLMLLVTACGGDSAEEELIERALEGADGEQVNVDIGGDGEDMNITVEGDDGEEITITGSGDDEEFTVTVEGEDGGTMSIGGGEVPEGLNLPLMEGGDVITSFTSGQDMSVMLIYSGDVYDRLVTFYEDGLPSGDDVFKSESSFSDDEGTHRGMSWIGDTFMVNIADCEGMESNTLDSVCVTLNQFSS